MPGGGGARDGGGGKGVGKTGGEGKKGVGGVFFFCGLYGTARTEKGEEKINIEIMVPQRDVESLYVEIIRIAPDTIKIGQMLKRFQLAKSDEKKTEIELLKSHLQWSIYGIDRNKIILDPGLGFGKNNEQSIEVLSRLDELNDMGPILLGASKKRFIGKLLNDLPFDERVEGTVATTVIGIQKGVDIVRVHNVLENKRASLVADGIYRKRG